MYVCVNTNELLYRKMNKHDIYMNRSTLIAAISDEIDDHNTPEMFFPSEEQQRLKTAHFSFQKKVDMNEALGTAPQ